MSNNPLVTVGIPTYNRPQYLDEALARVHRQTYSNLEILISDNHTPDAQSIGDVVEPWLKRDPRMKLIRQKENIGAIRNFKFLLDQAKGPFFLWVADDDQIDPPFIEKLLTGLMNNPGKVLAISAFDASDLYSGGYTKKEFLRSFQELSSPSKFERMIAYARQPDHEQKARILWGLHRTEVLRKAFAACYEPVKEKKDLTFAELPIEYEILSKGDLHVHPENLFHVFLLPSSVGLAETRKFAGREVEMCRRSFSAAQRVVKDSDLSSREKKAILQLYRRREIRTVLMVWCYYTVQRYLPGFARWFKKFWFKFVS